MVYHSSNSSEDVIVDGIIPGQEYLNGIDQHEAWMNTGPACISELVEGIPFQPPPSNSCNEEEISEVKPSRVKRKPNRLISDSPSINNKKGKNSAVKRATGKIKAEVDTVTETINNVIVLVQDQSLTDCSDLNFASNMSAISSIRGATSSTPSSAQAQSEQWCSCRLYPILLRDIPLTNTSGLKTNLGSLKSAYMYFRAIFTDSLLDIIVSETNKYAEKKIAFTTPNVKWTKLTKPECMRFVAILLHMGVVLMPNKSLYWSTNNLYSSTFFSKQMGRDRFYQLLTYFQLGDAAQNNELLRCHMAFNCFNEVMKNAYSPNQNLTIDRSTLFSFPRLKSSASPELQNYKGYGYMLCEDDGLVLQVLIFTELDSCVEPSVQKTLTCFMRESLENEQSLIVANDLTKEVSVFRPSKSEKNSMNGDVLVLKWTEEDKICTVRREPKRNLIKRDSWINEPVKFPLGVERVTTLTNSFYNLSHVTQLWNRRILFKLFHLWVSNGYILYNRYSGQKYTILDFHNEVVEGLTAEAYELLPPRTASPD